MVEGGGLDAVLVDAQARGLIGGHDIESHRTHALGFLAGPSLGPRVVDLGSGGGLPGLVLADAQPDLFVDLVDSRARAGTFLAAAVERLALAERVRVTNERAEVLGQRASHRAAYDSVVARSFGPPPVVAECAAPLLRVGGRLVVSEPPWLEPARWPVGALEELGLALGEQWRTAHGRYRAFVQADTCPQRFPRRVGVPAKRPLWPVAPA